MVKVQRLFAKTNLKIQVCRTDKIPLGTKGRTSIPRISDRLAGGCKVFLCPGDNSAPVGRERNHRGTPYTQNKRHRKIYRPAAGHSERCRRAADGSRRLNGLNAGSFQRSDEDRSPTLHGRHPCSWLCAWCYPLHSGLSPVRTPSCRAHPKQRPQANDCLRPFFTSICVLIRE